MPRPHSPEIRTRLLSAGVDLVRAQGFNASAVKDITAAARIPKGSFYNYFESKEAFVEAILDDYWHTIISEHGPVLVEESLPPLERIRRFFGSLADYHQRLKFAPGCLLGNMVLEVSASSDAARAALKRIFAHWVSALATCLTEARQRGDLNSVHDPRDLASTIIEAFEGSVMRAKVDRNRDAFDRFDAIVLPSLLG